MVEASMRAQNSEICNTIRRAQIECAPGPGAHSASELTCRLPSRPQFQALQARSDAETDIALDAQRLQRDGFVRAADQDIGAETEADGGAAVDTGIVAGEIALPEPRRRRIHAPGQPGLLGDADIDADLPDGR